MIVCKFGGTSVAGQETFKKIKRIVEDNDNRKIIVVSALGKNEEYTTKITDKLFELYYLLQNGETGENIVQHIFFRYGQISKKMGVNINWQKYQNELNSEIKHKNCTKEYIVSRGEYYSAILYSKYLGANFLDAKDYIIFNKNGKIDQKTTKIKLNQLNLNKKYVIGGYYGADKNGEIKVFDRGGSDITGALISKLLNAEIYENYTDVDGVYNKNPNIFKGAKKLPLLGFKTAIALAGAGNEVVHKDAIECVKKSNGLLFVKSTVDHTSLGTIITKDVKEDEIFLCIQNLKSVTFQNLQPQKINQIKKYADVDLVILDSNKYYCLLKNVYIDNEKFKQRFDEEFFDISKFTIFQNIKLNKKNCKKIKKIREKIKKYCIFANFSAYFNNYVVICKKEDEQIIIKNINKYF